jgi:glycerophosphoryl diester phosphodiesterase
MLEVDVLLSRDARVVCFHDERLERLTASSGPVAERDWAELSRLRVLPDAFEGRFPEARIPLLSEVLAAAPEATLVVELKPDAQRTAAAVEAVLAVLGGELPRCRLISFSPEMLRAVRRRSPAARLGVLTTPNRSDQLLPLAAEVRAEAIHPHHSRAEQALVEAARGAGVRVNAWTVNLPEDARRLADLGVDELTTDYPDRIGAALAG